MNKLLKTILILISAVIGIGFLFVFNASAGVPVDPPDPLVVIFETIPLFNEASFLPGDNITRSVVVTNNTADTQKIGTQAVNVNNSDHLGDVMLLQITQGASTLYSGTLSQFFNKGEIYLSDLAGNGTSVTYYYSITFDSNSGDDYQGLGLGFDIAVGFFGAESISTEVPVGGSDGGGYSAEGLNIFDEAIEIIGSDTVTITWNTNLDATSRVVYSPSTSNPIFDINTPPNYDYDYSTTEDSTKRTNHSVTITGLTPSTVYFFRCISHASPDTLSPEYSFATLGTGETPIEKQTTFQTEEILGSAIIRTVLPETGGLMGRIARKIGLSTKGLFDYEINILFGGIFVLIMVGLVVIRKIVLK